MMTRSLLLIFLISFQLMACDNSEEKKEYYKYQGHAEGTTFSIIYEHTGSLQTEIDSIIKYFEKSLSTYDPESIISQVNQNNPDVKLDTYFKYFYKTAVEINKETDGAFDITVAPLVNAWGFGFSNKENITDHLLDSLLDFVGMDKVSLKDGKVIKEKKGIMLDGNAIAKGYSVDVIADYFESLDIENYLVEIGGEIRVSGKNVEGRNWRVGIDKPKDDPSAANREIQEIISITDKALATSGNYRKFYYKDGIKYSHTIDPKTGKPVEHKLLSSTVIADKCITADSYATAFMVMGYEKARAFIESHEGIEGVLIYQDDSNKMKTYISEGIKDWMN